jgi:hypothetical protein
MIAATSVFRVYLLSQGQFYLRVNGVSYPSAQSVSEARPLATVSVSSAGCAAEIRMPRTRCEGNRVIGNIQTNLDRSLFEYEVTLDEVRPSGVLFVSDQHPLYRAGTAEFTGVCDGRYQIVVRNLWLQVWHMVPSASQRTKRQNSPTNHETEDLLWSLVDHSPKQLRLLLGGEE